VLDRDRILVKLDQLYGYLGELREVLPEDFTLYRKVERKRACERLLQVSIEAVIDICHLLVAGLRLGIAAEEDDLFDKLEEAGIISADMAEVLKEMKGLRNILVHEYAQLDDRIVYDIARTRLTDFEAFKQQVLQFLKTAQTI